MSHNSNNSERTALGWGLGWNTPHLPQPEIWNVPFKELDGNVPILGFLLLLNNQTQRQRPLAGERKKTEQSYNKPPPRKKRNQKRKKIN